jgi:DNA-binding NtrC family response regulator
LPDAERRRLLEALTTANWNKSQAAELLNLSRMTIYRKMAKYSLVRPDPDSAVELHRTTSHSATRSAHRVAAE